MEHVELSKQVIFWIDFHKINPKKEHEHTHTEHAQLPNGCMHGRADGSIDGYVFYRLFFSLHLSLGVHVSSRVRDPSEHSR